MPRTTGRVAPTKTTKRAATPKTKAAPTKRNAVKKAAPAKKAATAKKAPVAKKAAPVKKTATKTAATKTAATKTAATKAPTTKATTTKATTTKATAATKKAPAPAKAAKKGPVVLDKFLEGQRAALLEERATYTHQAESLQAEADLLAAEREPGDVQFDEESGEGDTLAVERERDLALSAQARAAVDEIDAALSKIADGSYGTCEQCGKSIPKERLRAIPYAALCVQCKSMGLGRR